MISAVVWNPGLWSKRCRLMTLIIVTLAIAFMEYLLFINPLRIDFKTQKQEMQSLRAQYLSQYKKMLNFRASKKNQQLIRVRYHYVLSHINQTFHFEMFVPAMMQVAKQHGIKVRSVEPEMIKGKLVLIHAHVEGQFLSILQWLIDLQKLYWFMQVQSLEIQASSSTAREQTNDLNTKLVLAIYE